MAASGDCGRLTKTVELPIVYESTLEDIGLLSREEDESLVSPRTDLCWLREHQDIENKKERVHETVERYQRAMASLRDAE